MRAATLLIFLSILFACKQRTKQSLQSIQLAENDTFSFNVDENDIIIEPGFVADTITKFDKETQFRFSLIYPAIEGKAFDRFNKILKEEIKRKAGNMYTADPADNTPVDTTKEIKGFEEDNTLLKMYQYKNLVSYGFLSMSNAPNQTRPFRKYFTVNYDTALKHFIQFADYFKIAGHNDSVLVRSVIYSGTGGADFANAWLGNEINFSFDRESVYFYFDQFGDPGNPYGMVKKVKKKYLNNFINNDYK
ncbi:MAG: hypothetical protein QM791_20140 [Ferruginibacter sp.]